MNGRELNREDMMFIVGGAVTPTWINAISKAINTLYELGRQTGSAVRRLVNGKICSVN